MPQNDRRPENFSFDNLRNMLLITEENFNIRFDFIQGGISFAKKWQYMELTQTNFQVSIFKNLGVWQVKTQKINWLCNAAQYSSVYHKIKGRELVLIAKITPPRKKGTLKICLPISVCNHIKSTRKWNAQVPCISRLPKEKVIHFFGMNLKNK